MIISKGNDFLRFRRILSLVLLLVLMGCQTLEPDSNALRNQLEAAFGDLYLAKGGLEFPHTEAALTRCVEYDNQSCLKAHQTVEKAQQTILAFPTKQALEETLRTIPVVCGSNDKQEAVFICQGGIMSLYFYNDDADDADILQAVKYYPKAVRNLIFNGDFAWFNNRSKAKNWIAYIESADIEWTYESAKELLVEQLATPGPAPFWTKAGIR